MGRVVQALGSGRAWARPWYRFLEERMPSPPGQITGGTGVEGITSGLWQQIHCVLRTAVSEDPRPHSRQGGGGAWEGAAR